MGIFDQLHDTIGGEDNEGGISPIELADLPAEQRRIMRHMLREVELPYEELVEWVAGWDEDQQITQEALDLALKALTQNSWLIQRGEDPITYEANLRRRAPSKLARSIWANLDKKIEEQRKERDEDLDNDSE